MTCESCGNKPKKCDKDFTKAVIEIDNPGQITLMRRVVIPASMGDDTTVPPTVGKYKNVLLFYEANTKSYLYSSDGIPTQLVNGVTDYEAAVNLPQINGVTLLGNQSSTDLRLANAPVIISLNSGQWSSDKTIGQIFDAFNAGTAIMLDFGNPGTEGTKAWPVTQLGYNTEDNMLLGVVAYAQTTDVSDFTGEGGYGIFKLYNDHSAEIDSIDWQRKMAVTDDTGLSWDGETLSGIPATDSTIGMVKPGDGLEVANDGTLSVSDIEQYAHFFDTVADMKAATNLVAGDYAQTLGYHTKGDYGEARYTITNDSLIADEKEIIAIGTGLYAVLNLKDKTIKAEQFGCYGDGTHDDTDNLQAAISYSIANNLTVELNGNYLVSPTLRDDNTYVCLTYEKRGTGLQFVGTEIRFNRGSKIKTSYDNGECTLLRVEARNMRITNGIFEGIQDKTNLLEFSRINKASADYNGHNLDNLIDNCVFRYGKNAISMEGSAYYNKFTNDRIYSCTNGIVLQMTALQKAGTRQDSNVNRNDFVNVNMSLVTGWGIRVEYGDTNKFVNVDLEGCENGIYVDNPASHSSDFPITPNYTCTANTFVNVMMETITTTNWYNNAAGTRIYGGSANWNTHSQMVREPDVYVGGVDGTTSIEKIAGFTYNKDITVYPNSIHYSTHKNSPMSVNGIYDAAVRSGTLINKNRQTIEFDPTGASSNITSLTYQTTKPYVKSLGGMVFIEGCVEVEPTDTSTDIRLYFPSDKEWTKSNALQSGNNQKPSFPCIVDVNGTVKQTYARLFNSFIVVHAPEGGWHATNNTVVLHGYWYSDDASV